MIGTIERPWSFLHSALVPALVVAVEAAWASIALGALIGTSGVGHGDVPFLALATPGAAASLVCGMSARRAGAGLLRRGAWLVGPLVAIWLAAATAYGTSVLHLTAGETLEAWRAQAPFTSEATLVLVVSALGVARGAWLAWREPRLSAVLVSVGLGTVVFLILLYSAAVHHGSAFEREVGREAAMLLFFAFPGGIAAVALVHERELERRSLLRAATRPSAGWLVAVGAPMALVAGLALAVVFGVAPLAPAAGRLLLDAARAIADALARLFGLFIPHLSLPSSTRRIGPSPPVAPPRRLRLPRAGPTRVPTWLIVIAAILAAVVSAALVVAGVRLVRWWARRPRRVRRGGRQDHDERTSLFSLSHLLAQLRHALARDRVATVPDAARLHATGAVTDPPSVRQHYRELLQAARRAGRGRGTGETPLELARRLPDELAELDADGIGELTGLYDAIRYGEAEDRPADITQAERLAAPLIAFFERTGAAAAPGGAQDPPAEATFLPRDPRQPSGG